MAFCNNCRESFSDEYRLCPICGSELTSEPKKGSECKSNSSIENNNTVHEDKPAPEKRFVPKYNVTQSITSAITALFICALLFLGLLYLKNQDSNLSLVKTGAFTQYPNAPIGNTFDRFFTDESWESFQAATGEQIVQFTGKGKIIDNNDNVLFQFTVDPKARTFSVTYLGINGVSQSYIQIAQVINTVMSSAK